MALAPAHSHTRPIACVDAELCPIAGERAIESTACDANMQPEYLSQDERSKICYGCMEVHVIRSIATLFRVRWHATHLYRIQSCTVSKSRLRFALTSRALQDYRCDVSAIG